MKSCEVYDSQPDDQVGLLGIESVPNSEVPSLPQSESGTSARIAFLAVGMFV
jgi:hypothetical protein